MNMLTFLFRIYAVHLLQLRLLLFVHLILAKIFVVWTKGVDKLCIADLTLFMIKGSFDFTILL